MIAKKINEWLNSIDIVEERGREDKNHTHGKDIGRNSSEMGGYEEKGRYKLLQPPAGWDGETDFLVIAQSNSVISSLCIGSAIRARALAHTR